MQTSILLLTVILLNGNGPILSTATLKLDKANSKVEQSTLKLFINGGERSGTNKKCAVLNQFSEISHQATCPFDFIVDIDPDRIPQKIVEQVCRGCLSCGSYGTCTQLTLPYEVNYRKTKKENEVQDETLRLEVRSSCICMSLSVGSSAIPFEI